MPLSMDSSYTEIRQRLSTLSTPLICDALPNARLMNSKITSMGKENEQCIGRAYPVNTAQDSLSIMQALDDLSAFLTFLSCAENDLIPILLIIASCGAPHALPGGMCANVAKTKGFGGIVTDGYCRDIDEIKETKLPFFAIGKCAKSGTKDKVGTIRQPIVCGDVEVNPGDIIFADSDGIVALSKEEAIRAISKGEEIQNKESIALQKIQAGAKFNQICNLEEHIKNLQEGVPSKLEFTL